MAFLCLRQEVSILFFAGDKPAEDGARDHATAGERNRANAYQEAVIGYNGRRGVATGCRRPA
jgi:hypothetical protein